MKTFFSNLFNQLLIASFLGYFIGTSFEEYTLMFDSFGSVLVTIMKMAILPYLCFSILYNLTISKKSKWKKPFRLLASTFIALFALSIPLIYSFTFPYFAEMSSESTKNAFSSQWASSIASGLMGSILENAIPWTLLATLIAGFLIVKVKKDKHQRSTKTLSDILEIVAFTLLKLSPIAAFSLVAARAGELNLQDLSLLSPFYIPLLLCTLFAVLLLSPYLLRFFSSYHYRTIMAGLATPLLLSFVTGSAFIALPFLIKAMEKLFNNNLKNARIRVLAPIASIMPVWSFIFISLFSSFMLFSFSIESISQSEAIFYSIPSFIVFLFSPLESMHTLLETFPLPSSTLAIFLSSFSISKSFIALLATSSTFILVSLTELRWKRALTLPFKTWAWKNTAQVIVISAFILLMTLYYQPSPYRVENKLMQLKITHTPSTIIHKEVPKDFKLREINKDRLNEVINSKVLRVGYSESTTPFSYFNNHRQLVGFDIAYAYELAHSLGVEVEFIPLNYASIQKDLDNGLYDIAMSAITKTKDRSEHIIFSSPVLKVETALTVRSNLKENDMRKLKKVALLKDTSYEAIGKLIFKPEQITLVNDYKELLNDESIQGALWTREESLAWQQAHKGFQTVKCTPSLGTEAFSYAFAKNSESLAAYVDEWLDMKKIDGFSQNQFEKWILRLPKKNHLR